MSDVAVQIGELPSIATAEPADRLRSYGRNRIRFRVPGLARVEIEEGKRVLIEPMPECTEADYSLLTMGSVAALLLHQRGYLPIHASAIDTPGGAVLFMGHSGAGKSTTMATLMSHGYRMISDDLAAIRFNAEGLPSVEPGPPVTKLWERTAAEIAVPIDGCERVRPDIRKYLVRAGIQQAERAIPVRAIYRIVAHHLPDYQIRALQVSERMNALIDHTWMKIALRGMGLHTSHFLRASRLMETVPVRELRRPSAGEVSRLRLIEALEAELQA